MGSALGKKSKIVMIIEIVVVNSVIVYEEDFSGR